MQVLAISLSLGLFASSAIAQCIPAPGTMIADFNQADFILAAQPIGFAFPFNGSTYTDIHVSDHGICFLSNGGVPAPPVATPFVYDVLLSTFNVNGPVIAPFWGDHTLGNAGVIYLDNSSGTDCTITWRNAQTYLAQLPAFSFQMKLDNSGAITFRYDGDCANYGSSYAPNAIIGVCPGGGAALPAASDLTAGPNTTGSTIFEEFTTPSTSDIANKELLLIPTSPGWVVLASNNPCASRAIYGVGCYAQNGGAVYEELPATGWDVASGSTVTLVRSSNGYVAVPGVPAAFVTPTATAHNVAPGQLDGTELVALSSPMPIEGGTTTGLAICTKGYVGLSGNNNPIDFTPAASDFLLFPEATIAACWHDWNQTAAGSGLILFQEIGGVAYVTWNGVYSFGGASMPNTFQMQFDLATGTITIVYQTIANDGPNYLVGCKARGTSPTASTFDVSAFTIPVQIDDQLLPLALDSNAPRLGFTWNLTTTNLAGSPLAVTFFGNVRVNPGLDLAVIGAPGCNLHIDTINGSLAGLAVGWAVGVSLPIPAIPSLAGASLTAQSVALTSTNLLGLLTSNGVEGVLGN